MKYKVTLYGGELGEKPIPQNIIDTEEVEAALVDDALEDFSDTDGICGIGKKRLMNIDSTAFWPIDEIGLKKGSGITDLYLLAFKLAYRQLQEKGVVK